LQGQDEPHAQPRALPRLRARLRPRDRSERGVARARQPRRDRALPDGLRGAAGLPAVAGEGRSIVRARIFSAALAWAIASAASAQAPAEGVLGVAPRIERLPNGLTVITVPWESPGIVAYYTLVRVGSRDEVEPGHSGFAHLF